MTLRKRSNVPELAKRILRYFLRNPHCADNFEGVVRWRLLDQTIYQAVDEVGQALEWLVAQGFVQSSTKAGTGPIFSLNEEMRARAERFIEESGRPECDQNPS